MTDRTCLNGMIRLVACATGLCSLAASGDDLPAAPDVSTPPILSEAKLWLDAWDYDTFQKDDSGYVTNWLGKTGGCASNYLATALGTVGVTNGVPAFLMGEKGSGVDLQFARMTNIRTVFWVMDIDAAGDANAWFLADSKGGLSFQRNGSEAVFYWYAPAFYGRFWLGDTQLFTWNARRWSVKNNSAKFKGLQVYALSSDEDLAADRLAVDKTTTAYSGGRALSELIIFDRTLSNEEVLQVKSYLNAKWKGVAAAAVNAETTPTAVTGYDDLALGENASFVLTDAVLGDGKAAPISVWGSLDKTAAGKIRLKYAGHVWNRSQSLFCVGAGGLSLEDFELTDFPDYCRVWCDGKNLWMNDGRVDATIDSDVVTDRTSTGPRIWLDASKADSFVTNSTGGVLRWKDQSAWGNDATNYQFNSQWKYPTVGETNGVPALQMGKAGSGMDLAFEFMDDIRTVFWVMDIEPSKYASFLGTYTNGWETWTYTDPDHKYTNTYQQAYQRSMNGRERNGITYHGFFMFTAPEQVYNGKMLEDGVRPTGTSNTGDKELRWIAPHLDRHVFSHTVSNDVPGWANNLGRCGDEPAYSGGKNISELIIFNRTLSTAERRDVEMQLMAKWRTGSPVVIAKPTTNSSPTAYGALTMDKESLWYNEQTEAEIVLADGSLTAAAPAVKVYGELRRGGISKLRFTWIGGALPSGTYTILECSNFFNCSFDDFVISGFPDDALIFRDGNAIKVTKLGDYEYLVPSVLSAAGESAPWIWLDASDASTFTTNDQGGVTAWADRGSRGNDAEAYLIGETQRYGTVGVTNGVTAYLMGGDGSGVDLAFPRTTSARTMFWVMDISVSNKIDFLGDDSTLNFQRGGGTSGAQYCNYNSDQDGFKNGTILEDGGIPHDKITYPGYKNHQLKPYAPGATHIYSLQASQNMAASCLSARKKSSTAATADCNGGRALSELVIFNRALSEREMGDVETYLELKWYDRQTNLTAVVDATSGVSYPHLALKDGAGFVVNAYSLEEGGDAAVTAFGSLKNYSSGGIVVQNGGAKVRAGVTLLKCAASAGISLDSFEFVGFPEDTVFEWTGTELRLVECPKSGLFMIVR